MEDKLLYKMFTKLVLPSISHSFFRNIAVIGAENIPKDEPVLICSNHNNQFMDSLLILATSKRPVRFIIAAKSYRRFIIGDLAKLLGVIPVERAQDIAVKGEGKIIEIANDRVRGQNTKFMTQCKAGDQFMFSPKDANELVLVIKQLFSDEEIQIIPQSFVKQDIQFPYKIAPKLDQSTMYDSVWSCLNQNGTIGIFPEGGSHDQTKLLPLKAGVCIMALGAMERYNKPVNIVCCGLNYYKGHRFRSKVIVEYSTPFKIPIEFVDKYKQGKREAIASLLGIIQDKLNDVIASAPDYNTLRTILLAKQIYKPESKKLTRAQDQELTKRFCIAHEKYKDKEEIVEWFDKLQDYRRQVKNLGMSDYEMCHFQREFIVDLFQTIYYFILMLLAMLFSLPGIIINSPIGILLKYLAEKERVKCLKASTVKVLGKDVVASYRLLLGFIVMPIYWILQCFIFFFLARGTFAQNNQRLQILSSLIFLIFTPLYAFVMLKSTDVVVKLLRKCKARIHLLFSFQTIKQLLQVRRQLKEKIREMVEKHGDEILLTKKKERLFTEADFEHENFHNSYKEIISSKEFNETFESLRELGI